MPWPDIRDADQRTWRFMMVEDEPDFYDTPAGDVDPPAVWVDAIVAVARDLRCFRYGRDVNPDRLIWELSVGHGDAVMVGWNGTAGISGFSLCDGTMRTDASFAQAARWVADTAQTELAGYDFVQWPSQGGQLLSARCMDEVAVWFDRHTDQVVAPIGGLCKAVW
ncbi:hypothetical protein ACIBED_20860 [Rhodococcus coprophilus]|uniref:Uncharacterized protein n=1 Tax=Rhodococcus coprophilus TaxID=38310 RepID=A0A2X4TLD3_9NOCA|nr:hypothetical protein [Rhodococcus coprophilus]MBM7460527.1 hypothetical protein [Rhodococcus coprophilus]SQI28337.1 Uncharacterised protein [Rhodococcus coprophilus]